MADSAVLDANQWYYIALDADKSNVLRSTSLYEKYLHPGTTFLQGSNSTKAGQRWQFYAVDSETYMIRSNDTSPQGEATAFMGATYNQTSGDTAVKVMRSEGADTENISWTISPSKKTGTFYLTNKAMGKEWRLAAKDNDTYMDNNLSDPNPHQQFAFWPMDRPIDDVNYSKVNVSSPVLRLLQKH